MVILFFPLCPFSRFSRFSRFRSVSRFKSVSRFLNYQPNILSPSLSHYSEIALVRK
ncbi:hypothetical protein J7M23_12445 [Candidatus Sumerlaeota bacterium]|nr:hypothetical protein [Candidatus Sumerlaeota bacterium]